MSIANIMDKRSNKLNVAVDVIFESSFHDNSVQGSTQFDEVEPDVCLYHQVKFTTIKAAIQYANDTWPDANITMFLYDIGSDDL